VLMIALRPDAFVPMPDYLAQVERVCTAIKAAPAATEGGEVLLPGEPEVRTRHERHRYGIPLPEETATKLNQLAVELGVSPL